jgi:GT2 family glycosyltransferase
MQNINRSEALQETTDQSKSGDCIVSQLILGNRWQQEERWQDAIKAYAAAVQANPLISLPVAHLLEVTRNGYLRERSMLLRDQPDAAKLVAVFDPCRGQMKHSPTSRKQMHQPTTLVLPSSSDDFAGWAWQQVVSEPADGVVLLGASMPLVLAGLFYKLIWGAVVLIGRSTEEVNAEAICMEEESTARALKAITIDQLKLEGNGLPDPQQLDHEQWMQLANDLITRFDGTLQTERWGQWQKALRQPRRPMDGAQLNCLEALAPALASPLMAARFWRWNQERIDWTELRSKTWNSSLVSIVIPVYGDSQELDACLLSLREADSKWEWEVIAVMNDATEQSKNVLAKHSVCDARIRGVWPGENLQFALGCNLGFAASRGRWLVLLNNDCRVRSGWLDGLVQPLQDDAVAATQPRLIKPNGTVQSLGVVFHEGQTLGYPLYAGLPVHLSCVQRSHRLQALTGACLAVRAQDFATVQGLDCRYINSQEDVDLCLRLLQIEGRRYCLSCHESEVVHSEGRAPGRYGHSAWSRHQFVRRWAERIAADDQRIYEADGIAIDTFKLDRPEFEREGISAGRAVFKTSPRAKPYSCQ